MKKRLYKSKDDKIFAGVLGGIGEYFDIDPTILRLLYILIAVMTALFPAIIGYIIAALVVPKRPEVHHAHRTEVIPE
jgi:phage shock protein C